MSRIEGWYQDIVSDHLEGYLSDTSYVNELVEFKDDGGSVEKDDLDALFLELLKNYFSDVLEQTKKTADYRNLFQSILSSIPEHFNYKGLSADSLSLPDKPIRILKALFSSSQFTDSQMKKVSQEAPLTGLKFGELFTGKGELQLESELRREIATSDRVLILMSFIKLTGLNMIKDDLEKLINRGKTVQIITTTYLGATDAKAIEQLKELGAEIRISYNPNLGRLHAKSWIFIRDNGLSTAYVGSSNLSRDALTNGTEWNLKITSSQNKHMYQKMIMEFESLWKDPEFEFYQLDDKERLSEALVAATYKAPGFKLSDLPEDLRQQVREYIRGKRPQQHSSIDELDKIRPYPFQLQILEELSVQRNVHGQFRNLVIIPTGGGKTVLSALDYKRFAETEGRLPKLLFVVHRKEILKQALKTFRSVLQNPTFGQLWVDGEIPGSWDHVFASIQTLNSNKDESISRWQPDNFDYIVLDEAHHGSAGSYQFLFEYFNPQVLLGLTATPERMDGQDIKKYFGGEFSSEMRLEDGISKGLLCPFQYYGISEGVPDLSGVSWQAGKYNQTLLEEKLLSEKYVNAVLSAMNRYTNCLDDGYTIGFCSSINQAKYFTDKLRDFNISTEYIIGSHDDPERERIIQRFRNNQTKVLLTVDLFNEGVDIPEISTVLFLRPTESLTVFLQQMGRGLRTFPGKDLLTIMDFVGHANQKYDFSHKFKALTSVPTLKVKDEIEKQFPHLPPGCGIYLEEVAQKTILKQISSHLPSTVKKIYDQIEEYLRVHPDASMPTFLHDTEWDVEMLFAQRNSDTGLRGWSHIRSKIANDVDNVFHTIEWKKISTFIYNTLLAVDSATQLNIWKSTLEKIQANQSLEYVDGWLLEEMGQIKVDKELRWPTPEGLENWLSANKDACKEFIEYIDWRLHHVEILEEMPTAELGPQRLFVKYSQKSMRWLLNDSTYGKSDVAQSGVWRPKDGKHWILRVTLKKEDRFFSESTRYFDWAMDESIFHWETPNNWIQESGNGAKFLREIQEGVPVYLLVREKKHDEHGRTSSFWNFGRVKLIPNSVEGQRPIKMQLELEKPLPVSIFRKSCMESVA